MYDRGRSTDPPDEVLHVHCRNAEVLALQVMTMKRWDGKGINGYSNTNHKGQRWGGCNPVSVVTTKTSQHCKDLCNLSFSDELTVHFSSCC